MFKCNLMQRKQIAAQQAALEQRDRQLLQAMRDELGLLSVIGYHQAGRGAVVLDCQDAGGEKQVRKLFYAAQEVLVRGLDCLPPALSTLLHGYDPVEDVLVVLVFADETRCYQVRRLAYTA
jgi:hypothetical protein